MQLPYALVPLSAEQVSHLVAQDSAILRRESAGPNGTVLVGVSPGMCEDVTAVELDSRTIVVVLHARTLRKNEFCAAMARFLGVEVTVAQPIDGATTVSR